MKSRGIQTDTSMGQQQSNREIAIAAFGVFSIINVEMGITGVLPQVAHHYQVSLSQAGLLVSLFALAVAISGPILPLLCSHLPRKPTMVAVLAIFTAGNLLAAVASSFPVVLLARVLPAFFQPVFTSLAFSQAAASTTREKAPQATAKISMAVSAGMVLGAPVVNLIVSASSLQIGLLGFACVNGLALLAVIIGLPASPRPQALSYSEQMYNLKRADVWLAIVGVVLLNGSIFGIFSYFSTFLSSVTKLSASSVSMALIVYGLANLVGNIVAGNALTRQPYHFVRMLPLPLMVIFIAFYSFGQFTWPTLLLLLLMGILSGCVSNVNQFWISDAMPDAPEFANGIFLASTNIGTSVSTSIDGQLIDSFGASSIFLGGLCLLVVSSIALAWRIHRAHSPARKTS